MSLRPKTPALKPGTEIEFVSGALKGLNGKVLASLPATERISILLDLLGREVEVAADPSDIMLAEE